MFLIIIASISRMLVWFVPMLAATMEISDFLEATTSSRDEWKFACSESGAQCVMTHGDYKMLG